LDGQVWQYLFAWRTPTLEGRPKTFHSAEIAFVFDNAGLCVNQTGGGPDALALGEQISDAWVAFARTGNPNHPGLPDWPAFSPDHPTMVFDVPSSLRLDPEGKGRGLLAALNS
jgi:para-nitrobenzyl esterase